ESWKERLLSGRIDLSVARHAGELLAKIIEAGGRLPELRERFRDQTVFHQLRIDPYYRTTAARHPELRSSYEQLIEASGSIRAALVHGDYSPKNMLVKDGNICLIDFEVVHWGDPAFDAGFLLNHLLLKSFHRTELRESYFAAAREFWRSLVQHAGRGHEFEEMSVWHLGGLMVARIDGKSPVEYIHDDATRRRVRGLGSELLLEPQMGVEGAIERAAQPR
ncbi:MAG: phosphotransferase family protein, partial [Terriglobia bacterium]